MKGARLLMLFCALAGWVTAVAQKKDLVETPKEETQAKPLYANSHALIIGIDRYPNLPASLQLSYATKDAIALRDELVKDYGFPAANVGLLLDDKATLDGLRTALAALTDNKTIGKDDRILIYFSGHGQTVPTNSGGEMGYLIPYDAKVELDNPTNSAPYLATCLPMKQVWDYLDNSPAKHALVIADACFGGQMVQSRGLLSKEAISTMLSKTARQIISAGDKNQETIERSDLGHGVFTAKLLDQLRSRASDKGVVFTVHDLFSSLQSSVATATNGKQTPMFGSYDSDGEFLFAPGGVYTPAADTVPAKLTASLKIVPSESSAKVYVDGKLIGTGTSETTIDVGSDGPKHVAVRIEAEGFTPKERDVTVTAGQSLQLDLDMTKAAPPTTAPETKPASADSPLGSSVPVINSIPLWPAAGQSSTASELGLSDSQHRDCQAIGREVLTEMIDGSTGPSLDAIWNAPEDKVRDWNRRVRDIVGAGNVPRLQEIALQMAGTLALRNRELERLLELTPDQTARLEDLFSKYEAASKSLFEKVKAGDLDRSKLVEAMKKNRDILDSEVAKILTAGQTAKLKAFCGKPIKK
ncbi:MAG TPA: caspase family protein [Fimbriimonadaceae bacterium]|nr:caspase family protein [Fimbriimonadaceae bacterium]